MTATRNLVTDPSVLATDDRAPPSRGGGEEKHAPTRDGTTPDFATPTPCPCSCESKGAHGTAAATATDEADDRPVGVPSVSDRGVMRQQVRTVQ